MRLCEVYHINIIANTGAVGCIIIIAEDSQLLTDAHSSLRNIGDQVVGRAIGQLADKCSRMGTYRVEIAKDNALDGCSAMDIIADNLFINLLGIAVRRQRRLDRCMLRYRQMLLGRLAVDCARRRKDYAFYMMLWHQFQ